MEIPKDEIDYVRKVFGFWKKQFGNDEILDNNKLNFFFHSMLDEGYHDIGMQNPRLCEVFNHAIYRLSDRIPKEQREKIPIWPEEGDTDDLIIDDCPWTSLESWRKYWESGHPHIPFFQKALL